VSAPIVEPPRRVRITHPRTEAARRAPSRPAAREIGEQTRLGEVYMGALIRSQRRLGVIACIAITLVLFGIALLGAAAPSFGRVRVFGIPLPWLVLGLLIYPVLIALAIYTVRHAERNEKAFMHLVLDRSVDLVSGAPAPDPAIDKPPRGGRRSALRASAHRPLAEFNEP